MEDIARSLNSLVHWIEGESYLGYDPYDLITPLSDKFGRKGLFYIQQFGKMSPVNLRRILGVKKSYNPKGLALISLAYMNLYAAMGDKEYLYKAEKLIDILERLRSPGFSRYAWGYNFPWASRRFFLPAYQPSIVVSSTVGKMLIQHHRLTGDKNSLKKAVSVGNFILKDLNRYESKRHLCFSYTPYSHDRIFNASLMGAELLSMLYSETEEERFRVPAEKAAAYVLDNQKSDGAWSYGYSEDGGEIELYDFHQGFVLDSLAEISANTGIDVSSSVGMGLRFYKDKLFHHDGMSVYRYPKVYPTDIHNQAQGIISFLKHDNARFAMKIADWTIENMQDRKGYFYYQMWPTFKNRIPYMRWGEAWMMLALSKLLYGRRDSSG